MPKIAVASADIAYLEEGSGSPLVLLHANPGDSRDFAAIVPELAKSYRVLAPDWPGNGGSPSPEPASIGGAQFYYQVLKEFLEELDVGPAIFFGNSVGGNAAARLAIEKPEAVRALVLVSPGGFTNLNIFSRAFCRFQASRFAIRPAIFARMYLKRRTETVRAMLARAGGEQSTKASLIGNRAVWRSFIDPDHDLRARAAEIQAPTLLFFGKHDPVIPAAKDGEAAGRLIPHSKKIVTDTGHAPFAEDPEAFLAECRPFLEEIELEELARSQQEIG